MAGVAAAAVVSLLLLCASSAAATGNQAAPARPAASHVQRSAPRGAPAAGRVLEWSGYTWNVRSSHGALSGPGPNYFSDSAAAVSVDSAGLLSLSLVPMGSAAAGSPRDGPGWSCAEVVLNATLGYGTYTFTTATDFAAEGHAGADSAHAVLGMFLYANDTQELDIEMARWGNASADARNADNAVQPVVPQSAVYFRMPPLKAGSEFVHTITWADGVASFASAFSDDVTAPFHSWSYSNSDGTSVVPKEDSNMLVHINIWLFRGESPGLRAGTTYTSVFSDFHFTPAAPALP